MARPALSTISLILVPIFIYKADDSITWTITAFAGGLDLSPLSVTNQEGEAGTVEFPEDLVRLNLSFPVSRGDKPLLIVSIIALIAILAAFYLYVIRLLQQIVASVKSGDPFIPENASRVRILGSLVIAASIAATLAEGLISIYAFRMYSTSGFELIVWFDFHWTILFLGLGTLVLAEIFKEGARVREEQSLTI